MKKITLTLVMLCFFAIGYSQSDTLYTKKQQKIVCKIVEINELDIKYKLIENLNGPIYVVSKTSVLKYTLSNGFTELLLPDEMSLENEHGDILKNRTVIKINPFSAVNNQISIAYENVIKVGMNLDIEAGYINNMINTNPMINQTYFLNSKAKSAQYTGAYIKPGIKFFLGQDFSVKGLKYAHPLKGRYIKLDLAASYLNFQDVTRFDSFFSTGTPPVTTNINVVAYGGFVNYGRQFILGNILTLEYYFGVGFTGQSHSYSNPNFLTVSPTSSYYVQDQAKNISNFHGFMRAPNFGLSATAGFRIGYIIPAKKSKSARPTN